MADLLPQSPQFGRPSPAAVREYLRMIDRAAARGQRPASLGEVLPDMFERLALRKLLLGQPDAAEVAEKLSPGILTRLYTFAAEGGR